MKYKNANDILPTELVEEIQKYVQGEFLYIPKKDRQPYRAITEYKIELKKRNDRLYKMHLEGMCNEQLAKNFSLSESSIRRIIIEQRKRYNAMLDKIKTLLPCWNLQNENITQIYGTVWQIGKDYVLKVYNESQSLQRNIMINNHLENMGISVGKVYNTTNGKQYIESDNQYFFISEKLHGSNIVNLKFGNKLAETMGEIIANLHTAFNSLENEIQLFENNLLSEMQGWVKESLETNGWQYISFEEYNETVNNLEEHYSNLSVGLIHRDVHFGNFLFDKGNFSGYIDFDLSQKNIRILDLCYFVLSVLSEKDKFEITTEKWFDFVKNVFKGYNKIITLTKEEKECAVLVMECIELLFLAYYEGQEDSALAKSTYDIFNFINKNKKQISKIIKNTE